jgi:hypothetical protein
MHTCHAVPMPLPCRSHSVPLPCRAVLIHTRHAAPLQFSDSAVSFVKVRVVAGNIRTANTLWAERTVVKMFILLVHHVTSRL